MIELHCGDCLDVMRGMPDASVDAVVTDPPYSSGGQYRGDRAARPAAKYARGARKCPDFAGDNRDQRSWAYWCTLWLSECRRLCRPAAPCVVFADWRQLPSLTDALQAAGWTWRGVAAWDKTLEARPQRGRFRQQAEFLVWGTNGPAATIGECLPGVFRHVAPRDRVHLTQKPLQLMREVIRIAPRGSLILDPFVGSGATGQACLIEGRRFVGIEQSAEYHAIAARRIADARPAPRADIEREMGR